MTIDVLNQLFSMLLAHNQQGCVLKNSSIWAQPSDILILAIVSTSPSTHNYVLIEISPPKLYMMKTLVYQ